MKVWAVYGVMAGFRSNAEWKVLGFNNLAGLNIQLREAGWTDIEELALVTHGDRNGVLQLDPPLSVENMDDYAKDINRCRDVLRSGARVSLYGCSAGGGERGDAFLRGLSARWAECVVVGFNTANELFGPVPGPKAVKAFSPNSTRNDEYSEEAKWAKNGAIIRPPLFEVTNFQDYDPTFRSRCGADTCPGHGRRADWCRPYRRTKWPTWQVNSDEINRLREVARSGLSSKLQASHGKRRESLRRGMSLDAPAHPAGSGGFGEPRSRSGNGGFKGPGPLGH